MDGKRVQPCMNSGALRNRKFHSRSVLACANALRVACDQVGTSVRAAMVCCKAVAAAGAARWRGGCAYAARPALKLRAASKRVTICPEPTHATESSGYPSGVGRPYRGCDRRWCAACAALPIWSETSAPFDGAEGFCVFYHHPAVERVVCPFESLLDLLKTL